MTGALQLTAKVAERDFAATLTVAPGEVVAVLGPNGAGKSTVLSVVAGLIRPDSGVVRLDGVVLADDTTWVPPHRRPVALLAQQALLFPHLSVRDNVAFAPRSRGVGRRLSRETAERWLAEVDALDLAERRPAQLSGGQQQRVAVARALAAEPALLLLDEPMAALDVGAAPALRQLLGRVLRAAGRSALLVTHDVLDALLLADRIVVLDGGRLVEDGPARSVLTAPRSAFTARIAGLNLMSGRATAAGLQADDGREVVGQAEDGAAPGVAAVAVFRPAAVAVFREMPHGSPRNALVVRVDELEPRGDLVRVHASGLAADITLGSLADLGLRPGEEVVFSVKATEVRILSSAQRASSWGLPKSAP